MKKILFLIGLVSLVGGTADASIEVVQSVPVETTLKVAGVALTQTVWIDLINSAKKTIDIEQFYISAKPGESLDPIVQALKVAATRGVKIRILVDSKFYANPNMSVIPNQLAIIPNFELKTVDFSKSSGVMHAKYFVVDQVSAYIGSANFDWLALSHIHEIGLKVIDANIATSLESIFNLDWNAGVSQSPAHSMVASVYKTGPALGLFASPASANPAGIPSTIDALTQMMAGAKTSIKIQVYEYNTNGTPKFTALDSTIRAAAARGVQVEMMVDRVAMKAGSTDLKSLSQVKNIQVKLITIPEWSGGPLQFARLVHSKYCIADDTTAWVGSENWSGNYFTGSRNVGMIFNDANAVNQLVRVHANVWNSAYTSAP